MTKTNFNTVLSIVAGLLIFWLFIDRENKNKKIIALEKEISENENLNKKIKNQLKELIENNSEIDPSVSNELGQIAALIEIKQETKALMALAKIIENLLKKLFKGDEKLKEIASENKRKNPSFADYLELARLNGVISTEDYHVISVLKIIRNEEAHELNVQKEQSRIIATFITGFATILTLTKMMKSIITAPNSQVTVGHKQKKDR
ncbi:hypothetical protein [Sunxiuqinia rutila]|uniref:hypothetical protein n=1 Tax=Sunxiuqinia rutila TaxID=1397841 RepID=UPI003D36EA3F